MIPQMTSFSSNGSLPSDRELLRRIGERDEDALSALYDRYADRVYSFALHTLQNPALAEEVTQDTFLKIWYRPDVWDPTRGKFSSWLLTVTRYTAIDLLRKEQRRPTQISVPLETLPDGHADEIWQSDDEEIRSLIGQLPVEQAQAIEYTFFRGMTHSEIALALQLPLGTVKTRLRLGLMKLRVLCLQTTDYEIAEHK
jgi:RNA polymerase sigma factor (sigma-70 family)